MVMSEDRHTERAHNLMSELVKLQTLQVTSKASVYSPCLSIWHNNTEVVLNGKSTDYTR